MKQDNDDILIRAFDMTPKEIVKELDKYIIGQSEAKKLVAIALRNRWRRQQCEPDIAKEILPKNILMIGPTGCGKTEISRRMAKLADAPFIKVEATRYTEVGYVGRDVESIIRDLLEISIAAERQKQRNSNLEKASIIAEERILDVLVGESSAKRTREKFRKELREGLHDATEIDFDCDESSSSVSMPTMDIPGMPGAQMGMVNLGDIISKTFGKNQTTRRLTVKKAYKLAQQEEADKLIDDETLVKTAIKSVEQNGIVFIDEFDKICVRDEGRRGGDVSREGVQRDLLPMIEGTNITTKHGVVSTDYILFVASGAFHLSKPSDLLPELQGRLPIRVKLDSLTRSDFIAILKDTRHSLLKQYTALIGTEGVELKFGEAAIQAVANLAADINEKVENIGARRLHTVLEKLLEDISFNASDNDKKKIEISADFVHERLKPLIQDQDLSRFIL